MLTLQTPQDQELCVSHSLNVFSFTGNFLEHLFLVLKKKEEVEHRVLAPFSWCQQSPRGCHHPRYIYVSMGGAWNRDKLCCHSPAGAGGGSWGGWSHSPFPFLSLMFGSKEHWTISDIMAQSQQGLLSSLTPQIKHPCPWDRQEGIYARSRRALFPFLLNSVVTTSKIHPWWLPDSWLCFKIMDCTFFLLFVFPEVKLKVQVDGLPVWSLGLGSGVVFVSSMANQESETWAVFPVTPFNKIPGTHRHRVISHQWLTRWNFYIQEGNGGEVTATAQFRACASGSAMCVKIQELSPNHHCPPQLSQPLAEVWKSISSPCSSRIWAQWSMGGNSFSLPSVSSCLSSTSSSIHKNIFASF